MPDAFTTNICFAGDDRRTALVTLSGSGRLVALDWPRPGLALADS
jgi:gluconolactonase